MHSTATLLLGVVVLAIPAGARADWATTGVTCSSGAFVACVSVSVGLYYDGTTNTTDIVLVMRNMQGMPGQTDSGAYGIYRADWSGFSVTGGIEGMTYHTGELWSGDSGGQRWHHGPVLAEPVGAAGHAVGL